MTKLSCLLSSLQNCVVYLQASHPAGCVSASAPSLKRIAGTVISFSRTDEKHTREYITHLVQSAYYDTERDIVQLQADPRLFELYQFDRKVLLQLKAINALKRRESAQALLYIYREPAPGSGTGIAGTAACPPQSEVSLYFPQNQTVRRAMEQLREIGYLDYTEIQRGRTKFFCIHYRRPRLKAPNDESKENPLQPSHAEKVSPEMAEKLALLENWASRWMTWKNSSNPAEHKL